MAKSFDLLRAKMTPDQRKKSRVRTRKIISALALRELRKSLNITQEEIAQLLDMKQAAVSRFESQSDMYISTLNRFVSALGGRLKLIASFHDREVEIAQYRDEKS